MTEASLQLVLCSTARLARNLKHAHARAQQAAGLVQWQPLQALTLTQWLESMTQRVMLSGAIPARDIPHLTLNGMAERLLWEQVIERASFKPEPLFDTAGMARSAMEANALMQAWGVRFPDELHTDETRQFLRWRGAFRALCQQYDALEDTRMLELQIGLLQHVMLPPAIYLAGFDRISPQERRLFDALAERSTLQHWQLGLDVAGVAVQMDFDDAGAECRAAVCWAQDKLKHDPHARLGIVVPELANLRPRLQALLDDVLHPQCIHPAQAELPRIYDFSLGQPLAETAMVSTALALLRLACSTRITQQETGTLVRDVYWSAGIEEADARALLDAAIRRNLPATITLEQLLRHSRRAQMKGLGLTKLIHHLEALQQRAVTGSQSVLNWVSTFTQLLDAAHWPGERSLSSFEHQAEKAWDEVLQTFAALDPLLGKISSGEALRHLSRLARDRIFQPEAVSEPQIQIMGMLEANAQPLDALWVMGMNDHIWPPPARANPLLPAEVQRKAGAPNSCSQVQAEFASVIHQRLLRSAPEVVFSWARRDGERELRMSPLLKDIPIVPESAQAQTLAEQLAAQLTRPQDMQWLQDHQAPAVQEGEKVYGGAALFQAQAVCPAWGYYQYRLGARALQEPVDGLDSMARGNLLHAVLQALWNGRDSAYLLNMTEAEQQQAVQQAMETGLKQFSQKLDEPLPVHFAALEKLRLFALLNSWLALERQRSPFTVKDCERRVTQNIKGISVEFTLDRVDELPDGELVVLDYKTGAQVDHKSWAEDRISEPQLPIYAALVLVEGEVAAVCFAKVRAGEHQFIGISNDAGALPGVKGLEEARKLFDADRFPAWHDLLQHWRDSLEAIADEIKAGDAAVCFKDEEQLAYCEVKPLLRLPERKLQMERGSR